ncbi:MAG: hypothetical protein ABI920_11795 [Casimicrobiaceae bacterium]
MTAASLPHATAATAIPAARRGQIVAPLPATGAAIVIPGRVRPNAAGEGAASTIGIASSSGVAAASSR